MAYGHVSLVLGVQAGLGPIIHIFESVKRGLSQNHNINLATKNRSLDSDIHAILTSLAQMDQMLRREDIRVSWSLLGGNPRGEMPQLLTSLGISQDAGNIMGLETIQDTPSDALIYVPIDVLQSRQIEQLARLTMICPRTRHVTFSSTPRWSHMQLMALKETWEWVDPKVAQNLNKFADDVIRFNGGITQKDIEKVNTLMGGVKKITEVVQSDPQIIMRSQKMRDLLALIDAVADSDSTILIYGESGTGKELIAQRIHAKSNRKNHPIVAVNCGAIPSELLESELFGHVKGAFTGAINNRDGRFQVAEGGTLFLDEIGEMGPTLQVKLLRVLQTRKFEPVGSTQSSTADVRIIAATNRDLEEMVRLGEFREDLFYRLNVIPVQVPALREKKEDIPYLIEYFIRKFNTEKKRRVTGVTRAALRSLVAFDWPGNIRELENLIERMVILKSSGMIDVLDFPEKYRKTTLSEIEYEDLMNPQKRESLASIQAKSTGGEMAMEENNTTFNYNGSVFQKKPIEQNLGQIENAGGMSHTGIHGVSAHGAAEEVIRVEEALRMLSDKLHFPVEGLDFNSVVDQFENILILHALERTGWNRNRAAGLLRLNRTTLVEKLKKKQLIPPMHAHDEMNAGNA
jgi:transcriptional regulator with PAS, ATPase and Fis domain